MSHAVLAIVAVLAAAGLVPAVASAAPPAPSGPAAVQRAVDDYLAGHPGGKQVSATDIAYGDGAFVVSVVRPDPRTAASADCPRGWFCFYDRIDFGYPRGKLSDCGLQDLAEWQWRNRTESVHYNMSTGSTSFINDGSPDTILFTVSTTRRTIANVGTHRNKADYVYRTC
ncbi:MAG TPA: peptidase inhibitor family I36 protein [Micromonosporaceae bacterium]|nr:peptidase inhibitor family I36 protein [Micromonosporaceae bacterium]